MQSRTRREPKPSITSGGAASAIEQLKRLRESGAKSRLASWEVEEEKAVYDVVDEDEYARIVAKRREEAGNFLEGGEDDDEYRDLGEDMLGFKEDAQDEEAPEKGGKGKKRKDGAADGGRSKKKLAAAPDPNGRARMQKMMLLAQARSAAGAGKKDDSSDALLEDILSDLGGGAPDTSGPRPAVATRPVAGMASKYTPAAASNFKPASRPGFPAGRAPACSFAGASAPGSFHTPLPRAPASRSGLTPAAFVTPPGQHPRSALRMDDEVMEDAAPEAADWDNADAGDMPDDDVGMAPAEEQELATPAPETRGSNSLSNGVAEVEPITTPPPAVKPPEGAEPAPVTPEEEIHAGAAGWREILEKAEEGSFTPGTPVPDPAAAAASDLESVADLELDGNGQVPMFLLDIHEQPDVPDHLYFFGKVQEKGGRMVTACAVLHGLQRSVYFVPSPFVFADLDGAIAELETEAEKDPSKKGRLIIHLQERAADMKAELKELLHKQGIKKYGIMPVKRNYAFDDRAVPQGPQWVLKVRYSAEQPQLPAGLSGKTFKTVFGAGGSLAEAIMLKRKIMGPGWILLSHCSRRTPERQVSWCKVELEVSSAKHIHTALPAPLAARPPPPITVASLALQTYVNPSSHQQQVVAASVVYLQHVSTETPLTKEQWSDPRLLKNFSLVCRMDAHPWPYGFQEEVSAMNSTARGKAHGGNMVMACNNERSLLVAFLGRLQALDPDVLVGHNITGWDLPLLLQRMNASKVPHWSRIGRLRRHTFPDKLMGTASNANAGASPAVLTCTAGRLLCDTHISARELVREVDYSLGALTRTLLGEQRMELTSADVPAKFNSTQGLRDLMMHADSDAWLALAIMFHLSVLPLSRQLAGLSGFSWGRTLMGNRAQRIEMLLLHEFHARKFLLPNKLTAQDRAQRKAGGGDIFDDMGGDGDGEDNKGGKGKKGGAKGPQYLGGLVLEPKKGLYDKFIILLDFNSLYPSIIQEFNICFTTVQRPRDGSIPPLPDSSAGQQSPLPTIIRSLVQRRKAVKQQLKAAKERVAYQQLNIRQQAIKLTANSMYGCLGFTASRFYAKPLAELITAQGRRILGATVDAVQATLGAEVVYGDTDSIMVNSGTDKAQEAMALGQSIQRLVNKSYKLLEIELEALMCPMLLLKKKKYAAIKMEPKPDGTFSKVLEQKGLDIVRRDWSPLAKECGQQVLEQILSGKPIDDVVSAVHEHLRQVRAAVEGGNVPLGKFVITKQLTKRPQDYPDGRNQAHVQVALRRKAAGKKDGIMPGETVPYIICRDKPKAVVKPEGDASPSAPATPSPPLSSKPLAERAFHPEEVRGSPLLEPDVDYYLAQQVHPVVSRLCAPIEGTDPAQLAQCLGLDTGKYVAAAAAQQHRDEDDALQTAGSIFDNEARYKSCQPLEVVGSSGVCWHMKGVLDALQRPAAESANPLLPREGETLTSAPSSSSPTVLLSAGRLTNQALLQARRAVSQFYDGWLRNEDDMSGLKTRTASLLSQQQEQQVVVGPRQLYDQLNYYHRLLDVPGATVSASSLGEEVAASVRQRAQELEPEVAKTLQAAAEAIGRLRDGSAFHWVSLAQLFGPTNETN